MKFLNEIIIALIAILIGVTAFHISNSYDQLQKEQRNFALSESRFLNNFMYSHRNYYQKLFIDKTIELNEKTLKALPAYSAYHISKDFIERNNYMIKVQTVSDKARNPKNQADKEELKAINYFKQNKNKDEYFEYIENDSDSFYYQYAYVLKVNKTCLKCHGSKDEAPEFIAQKYDKAYGYMLGEVRGIISVKIPKVHIDKNIHDRFMHEVLFNLSIIVLFTVMIILILFKRKRDIEELNKMAQKANDANKTKSDFLANMSHEIRTPLNAILGFVGLLKEQEKDNEKLKYLTTVDKSSQSLLAIINDILDFSKIESGKIDIDCIDFAAIKELESVAELFKVICEEKDMIFKIKLENNIPEFLNTDLQKLRQIISNLLSNAIKFTNQGKAVELYIYYADERLYASIKDEGPGIAQDKQEHIFEAFSQEDNSTTRKYGGTGLGLSISAELVKLLGGRLKVKSELGAGSEFYFSIPVAIGKEVGPEINKKDSISFEGKKILLVEDNNANQTFMKIIFKKLKFDFDIANDGIEAIEMFKNNNYDAILMDEYLTKPVDKENLIKALNGFLSNK